jgi:transposase
MLKEARAHQKAITTIIRGWRPDLLEQFGVGPIVAATVLCAWSHPGRIRSEAAFAMLAGVAPIPANSGQVTTRHRLNRYGDRQLNRALHTVVRIRIQYQPATRDYVDRRTAAPPHRRRQDQPRDQTLPNSLRRPRPFPPPRNEPQLLDEP